MSDATLLAALADIGAGLELRSPARSRRRRVELAQTESLAVENGHVVGVTSTGHVLYHPDRGLEFVVFGVPRSETRVVLKGISVEACRTMWRCHHWTATWDGPGGVLFVALVRGAVTIWSLATGEQLCRLDVPAAVEEADGIAVCDDFVAVWRHGGGVWACNWSDLERHAGALIEDPAAKRILAFEFDSTSPRFGLAGTAIGCLLLDTESMALIPACANFLGCPWTPFTDNELWQSAVAIADGSKVPPLDIGGRTTVEIHSVCIRGNPLGSQAFAYYDETLGNMVCLLDSVGGTSCVYPTGSSVLEMAFDDDGLWVFRTDSVVQYFAKGSTDQQTFQLDVPTDPEAPARISKHRGRLAPVYGGVCYVHLCGDRMYRLSL